MFLSGAIGGVCGMLQACGTDATLSTGIAGGVGFTAIIVAWLCQLNPGMILVVSFLFGVLEKGSSVVQSSYGLSTDCAAVLQGIILFFILASEFFVRYAFAGPQQRRGQKSMSLFLKFLVAAVAAGTPCCLEPWVRSSTKRWGT